MASPHPGVDAVAVNVTAFTPSAAGSLTVSSSGAIPTTRDLTYGAGITNSTALIVKLGTDGRLAINSNKATDVAVEVLGYYATATGTRGGVYTPVTPTQVATGSLATSGTVNVQITGQGGVPAVTAPGGVSGAIVQVKATGTTAVGFGQVWDTGTDATQRAEPLLHRERHGGGDDPHETVVERADEPVRVGKWLHLHRHGRRLVLEDAAFSRAP